MHKKIGIIAGVLLLMGCSLKQPEENVTEDNLVQETLGLENRETEHIETQYSETEAPETKGFETQKTTTQQGEEDETVVLNVLHQWMSAYGTYTGPINIVLKEELNIQINFLPAGTDVDVEYEKGNLDIIVWFTPDEFEKNLNKGYVMSWSEELLEKYGSNLLQYESDGIAHVAEMNGGVACGFANKYDNILGWDGYGAVFTIAANSQHSEEAMQLFNWLCEPDTFMLLKYGPQGVCWDMDDAGYFYLTEKGIRYYFGRPVDLTEQYGGIWYVGNDAMLMIDFTDIDSVNPNSAHGETYNWETWKLMKDNVEEIKSRYP